MASRCFYRPSSIKDISCCLDRFWFWLWTPWYWKRRRRDDCVHEKPLKLGCRRPSRNASRTKSRIQPHLRGFCGSADDVGWRVRPWYYIKFLSRSQGHVRMLRFHMPCELLKCPITTRAHAGGGALLHAPDLGLCLLFSHFSSVSACRHQCCRLGLRIKFFAQALYFAFRVTHRTPARAVK